MNLPALYRASMYVMLTLATLILSINATLYSAYAMAYPVAVAVAGVFALLTVDKKSALGLPRDLANFLGLGSFVLAILEYMNDENALLIAMGHWLVYLQLIKMFLPKSIEDDWFLFVLGLVQVVIGVYISQSEEVGGLLYAWAIVSLWTLGLFHLHRESQRNRSTAGIVISPAPDPARPYPGLVNPGFVLSATAVTLATLVLGSIIFWFTPRWAQGGQKEGGAARHLTGFSDQVRLGQMGEILENDAIVMTVELIDPSGETIQPATELLWRGATHWYYEKGRWSRSTPRHIVLKEQPFPFIDPALTIRQKIKLEISTTDTLFALRPIYGVASRRLDQMALNMNDGGLVRYDPDDDDASIRKRERQKVLDYEVLSAADPTMPQWRDDIPRRDAMGALLEMPVDLETDLKAIADRVLGDKVEAPDTERARALEAYLRDSGEFYYSLQMESSGEVDPILYFLAQRKEGHCEYFASALTLLLRAAGIPSRLVTGFKGGDWNGLVRVVNVREKHAHSWVEALVDDGQGRRSWITLDPTPGNQRAQVVARVGNTTPWRTLSDALRHMWLFNVVGFDRERQENLFYGPIRELAREASRGFGVINQWMGRWLGRFFVFQTPGELFSLRGFVVSVSLMLILVGLLRLMRSLLRRIFARFRGLSGPAGQALSEVPIFRRLVAVLSRAGLERATSETPREFAQRAAPLIAQRAEGVEDVPAEVVEAFYQVRFGDDPLEPEDAQRLESRLDALEASLQTT